MLHRKRILFAINSLAGGGAERVLATLLGGSEPWRARSDIHLALLDDEPRASDVPEWVAVHQLNARPKLLPSLTGLRPISGQFGRAYCREMVCEYVATSGVDVSL